MARCLAVEDGFKRGKIRDLQVLEVPIGPYFQRS
jgi:hypothetical protein